MKFIIRHLCEFFANFLTQNSRRTKMEKIFAFNFFIVQSLLKVSISHHKCVILRHLLQNFFRSLNNVEDLKKLKTLITQNCFTIFFPNFFSKLFYNFFSKFFFKISFQIFFSKFFYIFFFKKFFSTFHFKCLFKIFYSKIFLQLFFKNFFTTFFHNFFTKLFFQNVFSKFHFKIFLPNFFFKTFSFFFNIRKLITQNFFTIFHQFFYFQNFRVFSKVDDKIQVKWCRVFIRIMQRKLSNQFILLKTMEKLEKMYDS